MELNQRAFYFTLGFEYGKQYGEATAKEIMELHPRLTPEQLDIYIQGTIDGSHNDIYRLNLIQELAAQ